jgi:predicted Rossmann fold flavoprotein
MKKIIIVGGGAAGLMAAASAAQHGGQVTLLEKMPQVGKKLSITGKGRCNITNVAEVQDIIKNMPGNGSFLFSALHRFTNQDMIRFIEEQGVSTKVERGGRVFPVSDKAKDVVDAFIRALAELNVTLLTGQSVRQIHIGSKQEVTGVSTWQNEEFAADAVIIATGGASYPGTGSSGDGYKLAQALGHTITPLKPSLVPLEVAEDWIGELQGLSLKNVSASVLVEGVKVASEFGEMLFTHYGVSGPIILSLSKIVAEYLDQCPAKEIVIEMNLKPALSEDMLDKRIQRDFAKFVRKQLKNALDELLPAKIIQPIIDLSYLDPDKPIHQISKAERARLLRQITHFSLTAVKTRPLDEAIVTAGGVSVKEINPKTMESKLINNLYFAGEVIDIDGYTGGYNLQAAFSTGYVAGAGAAGF